MQVANDNPAHLMRHSTMNAVIACGGTGGHLFPGLAVAEVLRARGHEVMLFISEKEIDTLAVSNRTEFRFEKLPTIGLPSPFSPAIIRFTQRFNESLSLCRRLYRTFNPQVGAGDGRIYLDRAGAGRPDAPDPDVYSRIERHSRQSQPPDRADGARGLARLQGMRAIFSEGRARKSPARRSAPICKGSIAGRRGENSDCAKTCARCW